MTPGTELSEITVAQASPLSPEARALVAELDAFLHSLYTPQNAPPIPGATHMLSPEVLAQGSTIFGIARLRGHAVGCGALRFFPDYAEVKRMWVAPPARGLGVAKRVLTWLEEQAIRNGYTTVRLETGTRNHEAVSLYETQGYVRIPVFGEYTENGISLCYEKVLA